MYIKLIYYLPTHVCFKLGLRPSSALLVFFFFVFFIKISFLLSVSPRRALRDRVTPGGEQKCQYILVFSLFACKEKKKRLVNALFIEYTLCIVHVVKKRCHRKKKKKKSTIFIRPVSFFFFFFRCDFYGIFQLLRSENAGP